MGSLGIYVHVPFCVKKCNYCDFLSFPLKRETDCSEVENYVNALQKEICNPFKMPESPAEVDTIYLGAAAKPDRADGGDDLYRRRNAVPASTIGD